MWKKTLLNIFYLSNLMFRYRGSAIHSYILLLYISAVIICVNSTVLSDTNLRKLIIKRENDQPSWGLVETPAVSIPYSANTPKAEENRDTGVPDYCAKPLPTKPSFKKPGRRVSEEKCYEYIWQLKLRAEMKKRSDNCVKSIEDSGFFHTTVVGGRNAKKAEFPHMAAIGWMSFNESYIFKCGGSLISSKFVVTAAHCTYFGRDSAVVDPVPKFVRLGETLIANKIEDLPYLMDKDIIKIKVHPNYASPKKYYDIALLELGNEVEFSRSVQPACLWTYSRSSFGNVATVTGWGVIDVGLQTTSPLLQVADLDIVDSETCDRRLRSLCNRLWCGLQKHQMCAGKQAGGVDACQGDSGGPLQIKIRLPIESEGFMYYVVGITSFGAGCARPNTPGVYTRPSSFIDWIENIVWK